MVSWLETHAISMNSRGGHVTNVWAFHFLRVYSYTRVQSLPARRWHRADLEMVPGLIVFGFVPPCWHRNGTSAEIYEVLNCLGVLRQTSDKHSRSPRKTLPGFSLQVEMWNVFIQASVSRAMPMIKKLLFLYFYHGCIVFIALCKRVKHKNQEDLNRDLNQISFT